VWKESVRVNVKCNLWDFHFQVKGYVLDKENEIKWVINGTWDNKVEIAPVTKFEGPIESPTCQTGNYITVWQRQAPP